jgi:hypothetical protein
MTTNSRELVINLLTGQTVDRVTLRETFWAETFAAWVQQGYPTRKDVDLLCQNKLEDVFEIVFERGQKYRMLANGYALGLDNSIADYVPVDGIGNKKSS